MLLVFLGSMELRFVCSCNCSNSNIEIYEVLLRIQESVSRAPGGLLADDVKSSDALGRERSLPYVHFRYWEVRLSDLHWNFAVLQNIHGWSLVYRH